MRKPLFFFLCFVLGIFASIQGKSVCISRNFTKDTVVYRRMEKRNIQAGFHDSLNANQRKVGFHKKHRLIAAILALPIPFGIFGLHRIYLHTSPGVPLVYIATFGGLFGVLPFIDFVLILLNKDIHLNYTSNSHLFMWQKR